MSTSYDTVAIPDIRDLEHRLEGGESSSEFFDVLTSILVNKYLICVGIEIPCLLRVSAIFLRAGTGLAYNTLPLGLEFATSLHQ